MITHSFPAGLKGWGWVKIKIHDSPESVIEHYPMDDLDQLPARILAFFDGLNDPKGHYLGELHLPPKIDALKVLHEIFHICCASWRRYRARPINLGDTSQHTGPYNEDPEENFAYLLEWWADPVLSVCAEAGLFDDQDVAD